MSRKRGVSIRVALYGGSFDPPHLGHIAVIEAALLSLDIDKLLLIPAFLNPFKHKTFAPPELRWAWIEAVGVHYPRVEVCNLEIRAQKSMPTFETLQALKLRYTFAQKPYLIVGADNLSTLSSWYKYEALRDSVVFVVAKRKGYDISSEFLSLDVDVDVSSTMLRDNLQKEALPSYLSEEIMHYYKEHHAKTHAKNR